MTDKASVIKYLDDKIIGLEIAISVEQAIVDAHTPLLEKFREKDLDSSFPLTELGIVRETLSSVNLVHTHREEIEKLTWILNNIDD